MIKRAAAGDVDAIAAFEVDVMDTKLYGRPLDRDAARFEISSNEYYLHEKEGHIVATGALRRRDDASVYLSNIAVRPAARRQGLARVMMQHLLHCCGDATAIDLAVHPDNRPALALYVSLGFVPTICRDNFFGDGEPRLIMVRSKTKI